MNLYGYVGNSPGNGVDVWGLTWDQIQSMLNYVRYTNPDLDVPTSVSIADLDYLSVQDEQINGITASDGTITVDTDFLTYLGCEGLMTLYGTLVHEAIHRTKQKPGISEEERTHHQTYREESQRTLLHWDEIKWRFRSCR